MSPPGREDRTGIQPQLSVRRGRAAVEFYKVAFGAIEDYRVGGTDDAEAVVAQLSVGPASFWVADESPPHANFSPGVLDPFGHHWEIGKPLVPWPPEHGRPG